MNANRPRLPGQRTVLPKNYWRHGARMLTHPTSCVEGTRVTNGLNAGTISVYICGDRQEVDEPVSALQSAGLGLAPRAGHPAKPRLPDDLVAATAATAHVRATTTIYRAVFRRIPQPRTVVSNAECLHARHRQYLARDRGDEGGLGHERGHTARATTSPPSATWCQFHDCRGTTEASHDA